MVRPVGQVCSNASRPSWYQRTSTDCAVFSRYGTWIPDHAPDQYGPDTPANTLFQQVRIERQIKHHQIAGEMEVTPFGADFRAQHHLGAAIFFAKPGRSAVTFNDRHPFMEHGGADTFALAQNLLQLKRSGGFRTDDHNFLQSGGWSGSPSAIPRAGQSSTRCRSPSNS